MMSNGQKAPSNDQIPLLSAPNTNHEMTSNGQEAPSSDQIPLLILKNAHNKNDKPYP